MKLIDENRAFALDFLHHGGSRIPPGAGLSFTFYVYWMYDTRVKKGFGDPMDNARTVLIIAALLAVLLSAVGVERYHGCQGDAPCLSGATISLLPSVRFLAHPSPSTTEQNPLPVAPTRAPAAAPPVVAEEAAARPR